MGVPQLRSQHPSSRIWDMWTSQYCGDDLCGAQEWRQDARLCAGQRYGIVGQSNAMRCDMHVYMYVYVHVQCMVWCR